MPSWRNRPSMPNVRDSSGTIGTIRLPSCLSRRSVDRMRTKLIVVETSRSPVPSSWDWNALSSGVGSDSALRRRVEVEVADLLVGDVELEAVTEGEQRLLVHLLLLVGDVLALTGRTHAVA